MSDSEPSPPHALKLQEWWQALGLEQPPTDLVRTEVSLDSQQLQDIFQLLGEPGGATHPARRGTLARPQVSNRRS